MRSVYLSEPPSPTSDTVSWTVLSRFTGTVRLDLFCMNWTYCTQEDRDRLHAAFGQVTELRLDMCAWQHGEDFVFFLSAFPNLSRFGMENCYLLLAEDQDLDCFPHQAVEHVPGSALRTLKVHWSRLVIDPEDVDYAGFAGPWISHFPKVLKGGLHFRWSSGVGFSVLPEYLRAMGCALSHLYLCLYGGEVNCCMSKSLSLTNAVSDTCPTANFRLETCTELRRLTFRSLCVPHDDDIDNSEDYTWVSHMLAQVRSTDVENINLYFNHTKNADLLLLDFERLAALLSGPQFTRAKLTLSFRKRTFFKALQPPIRGQVTNRQLSSIWSSRMYELYA